MPKVDRREFLKLVGAGGAGTGAGFMLAESIKHPVEYLVPYPIPPEEFSPGIATWYNSVCRMCPAGCGISVRTREGRAKKIEGNPSHPVNQGRLCALGQAGLQALYNPDRLIEPMQLAGPRGSGAFEPITWEQGLSAVGARLAALRDEGRGDKVWFVSSGVRGHLADLFERFMGELGSPHLWFYDFAEAHALRAANQRFFGEERLPYYDIGNAQFLLSFGADFLTGWLSPVHHGLGFGKSRHGHAEFRGRFVQIEPKMTLSGAAADLWVPAIPGSEGVLALGIAHRLVGAGAYDGADRDLWAEMLAPYSAARVAEACGVPADTVNRLGDDFAHSDAALAIGGGAAANYTNSVDTLVAVNALNYLRNNIGKTGGIVFNPEPAAGKNAVTRRANFRHMLELAERARRGDIEVLIVNDTNPLFTMPDAAEFAAALSSIPTIVSLSSFPDETAVQADYLLPSHTYLESWGDDMPEPGVGFGVATISQPVVAPLYNTRATGDIVLGIARQTGLDEALPWADMEACLKEGWQRIFAAGAVSRDEPEPFDAFWRQVLQAGVWGQDVRREAAFVPDPAVLRSLEIGDARFSGSSDEYAFVLHPYLSTAMYDGRGANLPWMQELPDPITGVVYGSWVEINPQTAQKLGLHEGELVEVRSEHGALHVPLVLFPGIRPDVLAMPIGQGHREYGRYAKDRGTSPLRILAPLVDEQAGSLAWSATRVAIASLGKQADLVRTSGTSRELGRGIIQTTGRASGSAGHSAKLNSIPITVETT